MEVPKTHEVILKLCALLKEGQFYGIQMDQERNQNEIFQGHGETRWHLLSENLRPQNIGSIQLELQVENTNIVQHTHRVADMYCNQLQVVIVCKPLV